jgi:hypothetical protein
VGGTNETLAEDGPVGVAKMAVHGPGTEEVGQTTMGQFSRAAFFQRTLISSKLKIVFRFGSNGPFSLVCLLFCIVTFELDCAKLKSGSKENSKILIVILYFLKYYISTNVNTLK